jgi:hypothetical protein
MPGLNDLISTNIGGTVTNFISPIISNTQIDPFLSIHKIIEYKRQNLFILQIDGIDAISVLSVDRPKLNLGEPVIYKYPNSHEKFQKGSGEWQPINCVLNDIIAPSVAEKMFSMASRQWDYLSANSAYPNDYKQDITLKLLDPNGVIVEGWILHSAFLSGNIDWNANQLNYDSTDRLKISFEITYNFPELITGGI